MKDSPKTSFTVVIECCQQCSHHSWCSRHEQAKYDDHFVELKKKIEQNIPGAVVLKNQLPMAYKKLHNRFKDDNRYINETTGNIVQYPRLGAFEVYADGYLVFSKIESNLWPANSRVVAIMQSMDEDRKKGKNLSKFSLENRINQQSDEVFKITYNKKFREESGSKKYHLLSQSLQKFSTNQKKTRIALTPQVKKVKNLKNLNNKTEIDVKNRQGNSVSQLNSLKKIEEKRDTSTAPNGKKPNKKFIRPIQKYQKEYQQIKSKKEQEETSAKGDQKKYAVRVLKKVSDFKRDHENKEQKVDNESNVPAEKQVKTKEKTHQNQIKKNELLESNKQDQKSRKSKSNEEQYQQLYDQDQQSKRNSQVQSLNKKESYGSGGFTEDGQQQQNTKIHEVEIDENYGKVSEMVNLENHHVEEIVVEDFEDETKKESNAHINKEHNSKQLKQQQEKQKQLRIKQLKQKQNIEKQKIVKQEIDIETKKRAETERKQKESVQILRKSVVQEELQRLKKYSDSQIKRMQQQQSKLKDQQTLKKQETIKQQQQAKRKQQQREREQQKQKEKEKQEQIEKQNKIIQQKLKEKQEQRQKLEQQQQQLDRVRMAQQQKKEQEIKKRQLQKQRFIQLEVIQKQDKLKKQQELNYQQKEAIIQKKQVVVENNPSQIQQQTTQQTPIQNLNKSQKNLDLDEKSISKQSYTKPQQHNVSQNENNLHRQSGTNCQSKTILQDKKDAQKQEIASLIQQYQEKIKSNSSKILQNSVIQRQLVIYHKQEDIIPSEVKSQHNSQHYSQIPQTTPQIQQLHINLKNQEKLQMQQDSYPVVNWKSRFVDGDYKMTNEQGIEVVETSPRDEQFEPIVFDYKDEVKDKKIELSKVVNEEKSNSKIEPKLTDRSQKQANIQQKDVCKKETKEQQIQKENKDAQQPKSQHIPQKEEDKAQHDNKLEQSHVNPLIPPIGLSNIEEPTIVKDCSFQAPKEITYEYQQSKEQQNAEQLEQQQEQQKHQQAQQQELHQLEQDKILTQNDEIVRGTQKQLRRQQQEQLNSLTCIQPPIPPIGLSNTPLQSWIQEKYKTEQLNTSIKQKQNHQTNQIVQPQPKVETKPALQTKPMDIEPEQKIVNQKHKSKQNTARQQVKDNVTSNSYSYDKDQKVHQQQSHNQHPESVFFKKNEDVKQVQEHIIEKVQVKQYDKDQIHQHQLTPQSADPQQQPESKQQPKQSDRDSIQPPIFSIRMSHVDCKQSSTLQSDNDGDNKKQKTQLKQKGTIDNKVVDNQQIGKVNEKQKQQNSKLELSIENTPQHQQQQQSQVYHRKQERQNTNNSIHPPIPPVGLSHIDCQSYSPSMVMTKPIDSHQEQESKFNQEPHGATVTNHPINQQQELPKTQNSQVQTIEKVNQQPQFNRKQCRQHTNQSIQPPIPPVGLSNISCNKSYSPQQDQQKYKHQEQQKVKIVIEAPKTTTKQPQFVSPPNNPIANNTPSPQQNVSQQVKRKEENQIDRKSIQPPIPPIGLTQNSCQCPKPIHKYTIQTKQQQKTKKSQKLIPEPKQLQPKQSIPVSTQNIKPAITTKPEQPKIPLTQANIKDLENINPPIPPIK